MALTAKTAPTTMERFRIETDGTGYQVLHNFDVSNPQNGSDPNNSLVQIGSTLFGVTSRGGQRGGFAAGTIFRIDKGGTNFQFLYSFIGSVTDSAYPTSSLIADGNSFVGATGFGGSGNGGVLYRINQDGTNYQTVHSFGVSPGDFRTPAGDLLLDGSTLYGYTLGAV